jgi:hypothetical protein
MVLFLYVPQSIVQSTCENEQVFQFCLAHTTPRREEIAVGQRFGFLADEFAFDGQFIRASVFYNPATFHDPRVCVF